MNVLSSDKDKCIQGSCPGSSEIKSKAPCHPVSLASFLFTRSPIAFERKVGVAERKKRQPWSTEEDILLLDLLAKEGHHHPNWRTVASKISESLSTERTGKQCRERWRNHLRPNLKKGNWSVEEEEMIRSLHQTFGPKWSCMAKLMKNRTDNDIKNKWYSMMRTQKLQEAKLEFSAFAASCEQPLQANHCTPFSCSMNGDTSVTPSALQIFSSRFACNESSSNAVDDSVSKTEQSAGAWGATSNFRKL